MSEWNAIIDKNNRIKFRDFVHFIDTQPTSDFFLRSRHPLLVGKELYEGQMNLPEGMSNTTTMQFKAADIRAVLDEPFPANKTIHHNIHDLKLESGITQSIYVLVKNAGDLSEDGGDTVTVGRAASNNIRIADYVVSKHHAELTYAYGKYYIRDLGSTNGTFINGARITSGAAVELQMNSEVAFGRYSFIFANPMELYQLIKKNVLGR